MLSPAPNTLIQRKTLQACDACRARRVKCDGHKNEDGVCSNCKRYRQPCRYGTPVNASKWGTKAYIEDLQLRITSVERLIKRHAPDQDLGDLLYDIPTPSPPPPGAGNLILPSRFFLPSGERVETYPSYGIQDSEVLLTAHPVRSERGEYYGSSSVYRLVDFAFEYRDGTKCEPMSFEYRFPNRRQEFWETQDWTGSQPGPSSSRLEFPPSDVVASLVDSYFTYSNIYYPVLHRPTFQQFLDQELHQRDREFGCLLLVVCAIGTRFSNHPYVSDVTPEGTNRCMVQWLSKTREVMKKPFTSPATLFEVQYYCLYELSLDGFPTPMRWATLGIAISLAKSVGANYMKTYRDKPTIEGELWKRVFWVLLNDERLISSALGRPCSVKEEDYDLELPIDCDDEYWPADDNSGGFRQPLGKPSKLTVFILMIKLYHIQVDMIRAIYPLNRNPSLRNPEAEKQAVGAIDAKMDKWVESIPEYLRQTSFESSADPVFVRQSIYLHANYHKVKMWVRRPYTLPNRKDSPLAPAATAMCTSSAVACLSTLYKCWSQLGVDILHYEGPIFITACTFLVNILSQRPLEDTTQDRELLERCLKLFEIMEKRCHTASILFHIIGGMVREPNFNPLGPHARRCEGGNSWVVNAGKSATSSPTNTTSGESFRSSSVGTTESEFGVDFLGRDITFA